MKKIISMLLLVSLSVLVAGCAIKSEESTITVSNKNLQPTIYNGNGVVLSVDECTYTEGASDIEIDFDIDNESSHMIRTEIYDGVVDDCQVRFGYSKSPIKANNSVSSRARVDLDTLLKGNVEDFKKLSFSIRLIDENDNVLCDEHIKILREVFE